ncbi:PDR/VanB family oxidoreductase [Raineyella fluvialis]|uniref:2Fe-2S iron-sulfur cluster binding domain-containing protein n=1 Tax=Raineyella fluvialis TaxID=2662261 RepID=A0A5Q2FB77_9ACTN|nr:PDR/VanB family oxidoreductase [Raineyella fluvialis]QGF24049.1 2Fe-2S iron-sulfur cluster binding domain-containing protein [Raineyella fluvialis]
MSGHLHPGYRAGRRTLRIASRTALTEHITHFELVDPDGLPLRAYQPGSHLVVTAGGRRNAYSLVDDGVAPDAYRISVLRRGEGGGSDWLHDTLRPGDLVEVEGPRSMFAPAPDQRAVLLVAGGIGITPVLSHARARVRAGLPVELVYSYRPGRAAHLADVRALAARSGVRVHEAIGAARTVETLRERLADQPMGAHAYACGPLPLLATYERLAAEAGWPTARVHLERFTAPELEAGEPFTATVASTGQRLDVPAGVSLLDTLLAAGHDVRHQCRQGVCGECRLPVRATRLEHRDFVLTDDEKRAGDTMLPCVSRGDQIEVFL